MKETNNAQPKSPTYLRGKKMPKIDTKGMGPCLAT